MSMLLLILGSVAALICYTIYQTLLPKPIPGSIPYNEDATKTLLGDFHSFKTWHAERLEVYTWIVSQTEKLNSPIIQLFMRPFSRPWVVVADFEEAESIMSRRTSEFGRAAVFKDYFGPLLPSWHLHMQTGNEWKAHRKLISESMSPSFLNKVAAPQIYNTTMDMIQLWREKSRLARGHPFAAMQDVHHGALDIMWAAAFGSEIGTTKSQINVLAPKKELAGTNTDSKNAPVAFPTAPTPSAFTSIIQLTHSVEIALSSPFPRQHLWFALKFFPRLRSAMQHKNDLIKAELDRAWYKFSSNDNREDYIRSATDLFVQREAVMAKKENRNPQYDTPVLRDELFGFLVAGHDTSSITICWGLKYLTSCAQSQWSLREALRANHKAAFQEGRMPTVQDIVSTNVPYLDATIEEMGRLGGTVSSNVRVALRDTEIMGHFVPKGTDVFLINQGSSYVKPSIKTPSLDRKSNYGAWDPSTIGQFMPERWLKHGEKGEYFDAYAGPSHQFGSGPRGCFGRKFATLELKVVITLVLWNFDLQPTPPELSNFAGHDVNTHVPQQCYLRLAEAI